MLTFLEPSSAQTYRMVSVNGYSGRENRKQSHEAMHIILDVLSTASRAFYNHRVINYALWTARFIDSYDSYDGYLGIDSNKCCLLVITFLCQNWVIMKTVFL